MTLLQSLILGIIQGLTEFLPVSSTAHLILVPWLLGWQLDQTAVFVFDVLLQWGTLAAVIIYFWKDLWGIARAMLAGLAQRRPGASAEARLGWLIGLATVPAVLIGFLFQDFFKGLHQDPVAVSVILMSAAALLFISERIGRRTRDLATLTGLDALVVGVSQALALLPGVSRSAATISGGLLRNLERPAAARFSFLMSIPVLFGAGVIALKDLVEIPNFTAYLPPLALGFVAAAIVGLGSIHWLLGYLARRPMYAFAWYRLAAGLVFLLAALLRT